MSQVLHVDGRDFVVPGGVTVLSTVGEGTSAITARTANGAECIITRVGVHKNLDTARRCRRLVSLHAALRELHKHHAAGSAVSNAIWGIGPSYAYTADTFVGVSHAVEALGVDTTSADAPQHSLRDVFVVAPVLPSSLFAAVNTVRRPLSAQHVVLVAREVAQSLALLHANDIVLGSLTPETIGLASTELATRGSIRLTDLSSAHLASATDVGLGPSLWYAAPELAWGIATSAGPAADMWSLGCVLAFAVTGVPLFPAANAAEHAQLVTDVLGFDNDIASYFPQATTVCTAYKKRFAGKRGVSLCTRLGRADTFITFLLTRMLMLDPSKRLTAQELLRTLTPAVAPSAVEKGSSAAGAAQVSGAAAGASLVGLIPAATWAKHADPTDFRDCDHLSVDL